VVEYEALVLRLRATKEMGIQEVAIFRDAKLVVWQIRNAYQAKNPRLRSYRNEVWDLIDSFFSAFNISSSQERRTPWHIPWLHQLAISKYPCHPNSDMM
jgi:ribonuclease HI